VAIALVSAGSVAQLPTAPAFGQPVTAHSLLICWVVSNGSTASDTISVTGSGWTRATTSGTGFSWCDIWYRQNCAASEAAPTVADANASTGWAMLAEFSGAMIASVLDSSASVSSGFGSAVTATCAAQDSGAGDLIVFAAGWNGSSGTSITNTMADSGGNSVTPTAYDNFSTGFSYDFTWGLGGTPSATHKDTATGTLSSTGTFGGGIASFKPAPTGGSFAAMSGTGTMGGLFQATTTSFSGLLGPYAYPPDTAATGQNTFVGQDVFAPIGGYTQSLTVTTPGDWFVVANATSGNTGVIGFPNIEQQYPFPEVPLSIFATMYATFAETRPTIAATSVDVGFDIWLNSFGNEIFIQHDVFNRGGIDVITTVPFGGTGGVPVHNWNLIFYAPSHEIIWQLADDDVQLGSGSIDILSMLNWLLDNSSFLPPAGQIPANPTLTVVSYGFEICSTGGVPGTFSVTNFTNTYTLAGTAPVTLPTLAYRMRRT
jgi:hypothetical protein